jgi:hypothetical protein
MYYSIDPDDIKTEIEKHGHKVANVWNITQYRTKLPLSMFLVDLKPAPPISLSSMSNTLTNVKSNLNHPGTKERLPNAQIVNAMGIQKTIAIYTRVASNAPVII